MRRRATIGAERTTVWVSHIHDDRRATSLVYPRRSPDARRS